MQLIGQGDIVVRMLFVFLVMMLFAASYLFLVKAAGLTCRILDARKFLSGLALAGSLRQMRELVDRQTTIRSFSRLAHRIMAEKRMLDARAAGCGEAGGTHGAMVQGLIAQEAAEQAADLRRGLNVLAAMVWIAPLMGLVAAVWRAGGIWLESSRVSWTSAGLWADGLAMMQLGLAVAVVCLMAYLCLLVANRMYLSQFALFREMVVRILAQEGDGRAQKVGFRSGGSSVPRSVLGFKAASTGFDSP
ncbi:MotA/TolQ/ExbB proton channel family protein [Castellaniella defragrans]|uniref:MotA/TolQ/ExbB proton channel family protein n=1 Tax=Castellaniella defragrans TaxID=75697 RepID=UPI002AFF8F98|nr:MotA/TolQ/ExbB proton channel family protein [Castellaniella defragrans]